MCIYFLERSDVVSWVIMQLSVPALGTLRHQDTSALNYSAEVSGHFGTGAEV